MTTYGLAMTLVCLLPTVIGFILFAMFSDRGLSEEQKKKYEEIYNEHHKL